MTYEEVLAYFENNCRSNSQPDEARKKLMLSLLNHPEQKVPTVHVAGTNGKGSFCAMLSSVLTKAGYRTGTFISPHLVEYTERMTIDGCAISRADFAAILTGLLIRIVPQVLAAGFSHPNEFELLTMAAFVYFAQESVHLIVLETGLGGRTDPTNLGKTILSVIMPIGLDHCQILGDTIEKIAGEKAGIIKEGTPVLSAVQRPEAMAVLQQEALCRNAALTVVEPHWQRLWQRESGQKFSLQTRENNYPAIDIKLLGDYQLANCAVVVYAVEILQKMGYKISRQALLEGLAEASWAGRMEYWALKGERGVLFDGAHNSDGAQALAKSLQTLADKRPISLLLGILDDKDQKMMLKHLLSLTETVYVAKPAQKRAESWREVENYVQILKPTAVVVSDENSQRLAEKALGDLPYGGILCITGSLYLLGDLRRHLSQRCER